MTIPFHPVASIFPMMTGEEYEALKADIAANGLLEPIWLHPDGSIIDGRNRYNACIEAGTEPAFRQWDGDGSLVSFVVSLNLHRRHLTSGQRATCAIEALPVLETEAKERQREHGQTAPGKTKTLSQNIDEVFDENNGRATQQAAALFDTNRQYVSDAKKLNSESPELFEQVKAGELSMPQAKRQLNGDYPKRIKPKTNYSKDTNESHPKDRCQTPYYATDIITPYIPTGWQVWEPARGKGFMVDRLQQRGLEVVSGDILDGQNFFDYEPDTWDCLITNPPFSTKYEFLQRCYDLGKPFALLMPFEAFLTKTALALFKVHGIELVVPDARVDYEMPFEGYIPGNAPFASMWFTWGFGLPNQINYAEMDKSNIGPLKMSERSRANGEF
jgi:hypothetical protein